ncbi:MAG TPA: cupin domain-containing protein, partial [Acidimicrobiia bacterium]|nr:cupin domain-containing protein [Acidimicrobiia bacterium]
MARLVKWGEVPVVDRGGGIWSVAFSSPPLEGQPFTMGVTAFPPGSSIALHSHNTVEQVTVLAGEGWAELNGERTPVRPFDTTQIAPGEWHR